MIRITTWKGGDYSTINPECIDKKGGTYVQKH